ncbi:hypothetical protein [Catonella massiliensis]|uniref:Uncharacterized protein n=1 Tax=Catonella massiliensis TaxID=2799636 RepID=A0ABS1J219_9FIRM|nr:hypothetical protein [Catonella massiliensis]MBK5898196.1 hypothetical protein [Catonella massiliensis]
MKIYSTGTLGFLATITALVANIEISQNFNVDYPLIFWGGQLILCIIFIVMTSYSITHWDDKLSKSKWKLLRSIVACLLMYCIAYTGSKYAFVLIFAVGLTEIYFTRKKFGLVK